MNDNILSTCHSWKSSPSFDTLGVVFSIRGISICSFGVSEKTTCVARGCGDNCCLFSCLHSAEILLALPVCAMLNLL